MSPHFNVASSMLLLIFILNGDLSTQLMVESLPTHGACTVRSSTNSIEFRPLSHDSAGTTTYHAGITSIEERKSLKGRSSSIQRTCCSSSLSPTHVLCMVNPVQSCSVSDIEIPRDRINGTAHKMQNMISMIRKILSIQWDKILSLFPPSYAALPADISVFFLSILSGALIGSLVLRTRSAILMVDGFRTKAPIIFPLLGGAVVSVLFCIRPDLSMGPETIYPATPGQRASHRPVSKTGSKPVIGISPRTMSMEPSNLTIDAVQIIRAWTTSDGLFSLQRQLLRWVGLVATLGSGCAMALTGPAAELGMTVGRLVGFRFLNSENAQRQLILAAAGAGMTANFDTPFTGVFYAMEINRLLIKDRGATQIIDKDLYNNIQRTDIVALFLATTASSMVCRGGFVGKGHFLGLNTYRVGSSPVELGLFISLGLLSGMLAATFVELRDAVSRMFLRIPQTMRPIIGGAACSVAAYYGRQQSFASGFQAVARIASGSDVNFNDPVYLLKFIMEKTTMIAICTASGQIGGPFAHALFTGTALGSLFRFVVKRIGSIISAVMLSSSIPALSIALPPLMLSSISTYAILGMAGTISAFFKSPMTACILVLEMTRQVDLLLPLLATTGAAALTSHVIGAMKDEHKRLQAKKMT